MAPNRNANDDESEPKRSEDNPFISFRRFADEQVSGLLNLSMKVMGVPEAHFIKTGEDENRIRAYHNREQRRGYSRTMDGGQEGGDGRGRASTLEEEIDKLDREMTAWLNGAEWGERTGENDTEGHKDRKKHSNSVEEYPRDLTKSEERNQWLLMGGHQEQDNMAQGPHGQVPVEPSCRRGPWHFRFGHCRREKERSQHDEEMENRQSKSESEWKGFTRRIETEKQAPKVHTWHWSWSYPPRTSEETHRDAPNPMETSNTGAQQLERHVENGLWNMGEMMRRNFPTRVPFPPLGYGLGFSTNMIRFLALNDYSPLQLESSISESDIAWREAFEDLVRVETGQPLLNEKELRETEQGSKGHWSSQLLSRTLLNPHMSEKGMRTFWSWPPAIGEAPFARDFEQHIPSSRWIPEAEDEDDADEHDSYEYGHDHEDQHEDPPTPRPDTYSSTFPQVSEDDSEEGPETELDAYERLLGPTPFTPSKNQQQSEAGRPSILSTLTTTERTTHSDGTVTTRMVLKKRFADGREESSETVHTTQGHEKHMEPEFPPGATVQQQVKQQEVPLKQNTEKKSRGWFWS